MISSPETGGAGGKGQKKRNKPPPLTNGIKMRGRSKCVKRTWLVPTSETEGYRRKGRGKHGKKGAWGKGEASKQVRLTYRP